MMPRVSASRKRVDPAKAEARKAQKSLLISKGVDSGLELSCMEDLKAREIAAVREPFTVPYQLPTSHYTPDALLLHNWILIETKGRWVGSDRTKLKLVLKQHPALWIGHLFENARRPIKAVKLKGMSDEDRAKLTTYGSYCDKAKWPWAESRKGIVPQEWIDIPYCPEREAAVRALLGIPKNAKASLHAHI